MAGGPCDFGVAQLRRLSGDSGVQGLEGEILTSRTDRGIIWKTCRSEVVD